MRGDDQQQTAMFSYVATETRIPKDHPLRAVKYMADQALRGLSKHFARIYSPIGRPSIAPEKLLRALLLQALYSVRSERLLIEQLDYNLLFRWFVGLNPDDAIWDVTVFTKNRDRLLEGEIAPLFFEQVLAQARTAKLLSDEHFTVDGTLIEAWASHKSFKRKDGSDGEQDGGTRNPTVNFHDDKRCNDTHASTTDPEARLYRKSNGKEAKLCYLGHATIEHKNGLVVGCTVSQATGRAEREAALEMLDEIPRAKLATVSADKAYDTRAFVAACRERGLTPHVAQNTSGRSSAIDARTTRHAGYAISQKKRKRVEEPFGWVKTIAGMRKVKYRGRRLVGWMFTLAITAYNLIRMRKLVEVPA